MRHTTPSPFRTASRFGHWLSAWAAPLTALTLCAALTGCNGKPTRPPNEPDKTRVQWMFEQRERGAVIATPLVAGDRLYVAAIQDAGLAAHGALYCLDRHTGKRVWTFDDDGAMQHMYSSPCLADGRLYLGEGMHANHVCKLYCLDAATGRKLWDVQTAGHIESTPCVADGKVYFGSGDDGLYCLDAATGKKRWQFQEELHIDANPVVAGKRVYAGSGLSRRYKKTEVFCLDADTGAVVWRLPTDLPAWGSPTVDGDHVVFGLGNGRLLKSVDPPEKPAGAVLCVEAATGRRWWRHEVSDGVLVQPLVDNGRVYYVARDGSCTCLNRGDGRQLWKTDLGGPVVARPARLHGRVYVAASHGRFACLDAADGKLLWSFDVARHSQTTPRLLSGPVAVAEPNGARRIYFGSELRGPDSSAAVVYCLRD